jgi:hypothetical protein
MKQLYTFRAGMAVESPHRIVSIVSPLTSRPAPASTTCRWSSFAPTAPMTPISLVAPGAQTSSEACSSASRMDSCTGAVVLEGITLPLPPSQRAPDRGGVTRCTVLYRKECGWCSPSDRRVRVPNAFTFRYSVVQRVTFTGGRAYRPWISQPVAPSPNAPPAAHTPARPAAAFIR